VIVVACKVDLLEKDSDRTECHDSLSRLTTEVQAAGGYLTSAKTTEGLAGLFSAVASLCPPAVETAKVAVEETQESEAGNCC
jgi:predicted GTPase